MTTDSSNVIDRDAALLASAESLTFKELEDGSELRAHVFFPPGDPAGKQRPALVYFFGSAFDTGRVTQFAPQALFFSRRGAVTILFEYRTRTSHQASPLQAMQDGRSAIRWVRYYSDQLGVDSSRIVAVGALAGATVAAASVMKTDLPDDETDPPGINGAPSALILFSPVLEVTKAGFASEAFTAANLPLKSGALTPYITKGLPPTLILHGTQSQLMPFSVVEKFIKKMRRKRNECYLVAFHGRQHSFFNLNVDPATYDACNAEIERFLAGEGFLDPLPETGESDVGEVKEIA